MDFAPNLSANAFLLTIFGAFIIPQLYFGIKHRTIGFTSAILVGLALEVVGYVGAIQVHFSPATLPPALIGLTLGPTFIAAAVYVCLEYVRHIYDPENRITTTRARIYTCVFWTFSLIGLGMQIAGALLARYAENQTKLRNGTVLLAIGYAAQFQPLIMSCVLYLHFYRNIKHFRTVRENGWVEDIKHFLWAYFFAGIFIIFRCIFRVVEFSLPPYYNVIARHESFVLGFDGVMMILVCIILAVMHPGVMLAAAYQQAGEISRWKSTGERIQGRQK